MKGGRKVVRWTFILIFPLVFLISHEEAYGQHHKSINKDGTISFSDNPTSSLLNKDPNTKAAGSQKELEKSPSPGSGSTSDKEATLAVLQTPAEKS